jgi:hypothetical protein
MTASAPVPGCKNGMTPKAMVVRLLQDNKGGDERAPASGRLCVNSDIVTSGIAYREREQLI